MRVLFQRSRGQVVALLGEYRRGAPADRLLLPPTEPRSPAPGHGNPGRASGLELPRAAQRRGGQPRTACGYDITLGEAHAGRPFRFGARARAACSLAELHGPPRGAQPGGGHIPSHPGRGGRLRAGPVGPRPLLPQARCAHRHLRSRQADDGRHLLRRLRDPLLRHAHGVRARGRVDPGVGSGPFWSVCLQGRRAPFVPGVAPGAARRVPFGSRPLGGGRSPAVGGALAAARGPSQASVPGDPLRASTNRTS